MHSVSLFDTLTTVAVQPFFDLRSRDNVVKVGPFCVWLNKMKLILNSIQACVQVEVSLLFQSWGGGGGLKMELRLPQLLTKLKLNLSLAKILK